MKEIASKELKTYFEGIFGGGTHHFGMFVIRCASQIEMTQTRVVEAIRSHLNEEIGVRLGQQGTDPRDVREVVNTIFNCPILTWKTDVIDIDGTNIYYYQIVLDTSSLVNDTGMRATKAAVLERLLYETVYRAYGRDWMVPSIGTAGFIYTLANVNTMDVAPFKMGSTDELMVKARKICFKPKYDFAFSIEIDNTKSYNRHSMIKYTLKAYESLQDAFENKTKKTVLINQVDDFYGKLLFVNTRCDRNGVYTIVALYDNKPKLVWYNDMAVFYDGEKSFKAMEPYFEEYANMGVKQLDILQFCGNKDFFYQEFNRNNNPLGKMVFIFASTSRIIQHKTMFDITRRSINGCICYAPVKGKLTNIDLIINTSIRMNGTSYIGTYIIPVQTDGSCNAPIADLTDMLSQTYRYIVLGEGFTYDIEAQANRYKASLMGETQVYEPDTLSEWFKYCTKASRKTDNGIILAYEKMRTSLEKEQEDLKKYLDHYDYSKCLPVPVIKADGKILKNYYKSLHIEPQNVIINSVNNKRITSFEEIKPMVAFMFVDKVKNMVYQRQFELTKFYNPKENAIIFVYDKMRGEITRDKTKNRR